MLSGPERRSGIKFDNRAAGSGYFLFAPAWFDNQSAANLGSGKMAL
jgi:hypothetical protein